MLDDIGRTPDPAALADRLAIQEVLALHSRGIDRLEADWIAAAYWPDAEVAYGSFEGNAHEFARMVVGALDAGFELTQHCVTNTLVALAGNEARSESCVSAYHLLRGGEREMAFSGRYLDRFEKRGERWKILHRRVVMDWSRQWSVEDERESPAFAGLAKGRHGPDDPLHGFLAGLAAKGSRRAG